MRAAPNDGRSSPVGVFGETTSGEVATSSGPAGPLLDIYELDRRPIAVLNVDKSREKEMAAHPWWRAACPGTTRAWVMSAFRSPLPRASGA